MKINFLNFIYTSEWLKSSYLIESISITFFITVTQAIVLTRAVQE